MAFRLKNATLAFRLKNATLALCKFRVLKRERRESGLRMAALYDNLMSFFYSSEYDSQEHSAVEVKQEIEKHLQEKEILENTIPSQIVIGPYQVSTEGVRQKLANKRKVMANQVIELLAKKLRKQNDEVG